MDLSEGKFWVNEKRVRKLKEHIAFLKARPKPTAREIATLTGYLVSMSLAFGPVVRLWTRALYRMIENRIS